MTTDKAGIPSIAPGARRSSPRVRLIPCLVALSGALTQIAYTRLGGFYLDDIRNLGQAKAGLSLRLLTQPIMGVHFQPASRLVQWLVADPLHTDYLAAETILAVFTGIATYLLIRLLDTLITPRALHLVIGFLFATSWLLLNTDQWFSGADTVPAVALTIGACLSFVSWLKGGGRTQYLAALTSTAAAVLFWEQALAIPGWLFLMWLCFARDSGQPARKVVLALAPFAGVSLAYLAYVDVQPWHQALTVPPLSEWAKWLWIPALHGVAPALIGSGTASTWRTMSVLASSIGLTAMGTWLAIRRQLRWSSLTFFALGAVLVMAPVATGRTADGPEVDGTTPRYLVFLLFIAAVAIAGSVQIRPLDAHPRRSMRALWLSSTSATALAVLYLVNLNATFRATWFNEDSGRAAAAYSRAVDAGLSALGPALRTSVVDSVLPFPVWYSTSDGLNELTSLLPFWSSKTRAFGEGPRLTALDPNGALRWATFRAGGKGSSDVRVTVSTASRSTITVSIRAANPTEPETPWRIPVAPGVHSFTLPSWSSDVDSVIVRGARLLDIQIGTVTLGSTVAPRLHLSSAHR